MNSIVFLYLARGHANVKSKMRLVLHNGPPCPHTLTAPVLPRQHDAARQRAQRCPSHPRHIANAAINQMPDNPPYPSPLSERDKMGEEAKSLLPYLGNELEVLDCPANPGPHRLPEQRRQRWELPSHPCWIEYEFKGSPCCLAGP